jgi:hypothetical protein
MSLKRKLVSEPNSTFENQHTGSNLTVIAGQEKKKFYADLFTLSRRSQYVAKRFEGKSSGELDLHNYASDIVRDLLSVHYDGDIRTEPTAEGMQAWVENMLELAVFLEHLEVIEYLVVCYMKKMSPQMACEMLMKHGVDKVRGSEMIMYDHILRDNDAHAMMWYLFSVGGKESAAFREYLKVRLDSHLDTILMQGDIDGFSSEASCYLREMLGLKYPLNGFQMVAEAVCQTCDNCLDPIQYTPLGKDTPIMECIPCLINTILKQ